MNRFIRFLILFLALARALNAGNAVQFSASPHEFVGEGIVYHRLVFQNNGHPVFYMPPASWRPRILEGRLELLAPDKTFADARIESFGCDVEIPLDEKKIAALIQQVSAAIPPGARNAILLKQEPNALPCGGHPTLELVVAYDVAGQTFERAVVFVETPVNELSFRFTAPKAEFNGLYRLFRSSITTWDEQSSRTEATASLR